jgi:hypothetical protein
MNEKEKVLTSCFLWSWWDARNKANAGEGMPVVEEVQHKTLEAAFNSDLQQRTEANQRPVHTHNQTWCPPPTGVLKINTDAAFREMEKKGAWGFVMRDCAD